MKRPDWTLPHWTSRPGFGVAALLLAGILLVVHGEPQPSSRPSGTSVVVSDTSPAPIAAQASLVVRAGSVEWRHGSTYRSIALPPGTRPTELLQVNGGTILLAVRESRQHAFLIDKQLRANDLGLADGVIPSGVGNASFVIETAIGLPGLVGPRPDPSPTASPTSSATPPPAEDALPDFTARRYDAKGAPIGIQFGLPTATRLAVDTTLGTVVWRPESRVYDRGVPLEPLSAAAYLMRPDGTERALGPVHPLAASATDLLVWDIKERRFGLMPLPWITSTSTTTASPTQSETQSQGGSESVEPSGTRSARPSATPTVVAGTRWYGKIRGIVVTGPAAFDDSGSRFAVYAEVGSRRRLVVAGTANLDAPVAVLALTQPTATATAPTGATPSGAVSPSPGGTPNDSTSPSEAPSGPLFAPEGFPITAPLSPIWWGDVAIGVAQDGTVIAYRPTLEQAKVVDIGATGIESLANAP